MVSQRSINRSGFVIGVGSVLSPQGLRRERFLNSRALSDIFQGGFFLVKRATRQFGLWRMAIVKPLWGYQLKSADAGCIPSLFARGDAERLHLAIEMAALEAEQLGRVADVVARFFDLLLNKLTLVGVARLLQA
jgi:hypothetical protein